MGAENSEKNGGRSPKNGGRNPKNGGRLIKKRGQKPEKGGHEIFTHPAPAYAHDVLLTDINEQGLAEVSNFRLTCLLSNYLKF